MYTRPRHHTTTNLFITLEFDCSSLHYQNNLMHSVAYLLIVCGVIALAQSASNIDKYKIKDVTVSGISSGGYMAVQMHISHSSIINGSAIFAAVCC